MGREPCHTKRFEKQKEKIMIEHPEILEKGEVLIVDKHWSFRVDYVSDGYVFGYFIGRLRGFHRNRYTEKTKAKLTLAEARKLKRITK